MRRLIKPLRVLANIAILAVFAFGGLMLVATVIGMHHYVILTGSMTGTYDRGSIVFDESIPVGKLKIGDPITYSPPPGSTTQARVTHRILHITRGRDGLRTFKTKGDANVAPDPWEFNLPQPVQDRVAFSLPYVGYGLMALSIPKYRIVLIGIPALLIGVALVRSMLRDARTAEPERAPGWGDVAAGAAPDGDPELAPQGEVGAVFVPVPHAVRPRPQRPAPAPRQLTARGPRIPQLPTAVPSLTH